MALSNDLISQFVKATKDTESTKKESTVYGKIVKQGDVQYVQLDGSDLLTPIESTTTVKDGDRVMVTIKNHTAIVTGDFTNPSANTKDVIEIGNQITEFEIIMADKVNTQDLEAINAYIENIKAVTGKYEELSSITAEIETLQAKYANMEYISAKDVEIINAEIETLRGKLAEFTQISTEDLDAVNAEFDNVVAYNATFTYVSADVIDAIDANIKNLQVDKLDAKKAEITYANIDFSNIEEAAIEKLFTDSGIIKDLVIQDGKVTGELVGVTIKGDLIEGNTIKADKLVVLGTDGLYYKLNLDSLGAEIVESDEQYQNGLDGSVILAKSITADRIDVNDLIAFGATIGGFHINEHALYSGVKESVLNTTRGVYLGDDGQMAIGDANNYLRYYKNENGEYQLDFRFGGTTIDETVNDLEGRINESINNVINTVDNSVNALDENINELSKEIDSKVGSEEVDNAIKTELDKGVGKVVTSTGFTFNNEGLTISKTGSPMTTKIDEDGMIIKNNNVEQLIANNKGVVAYDLHAKTYLIVGSNSRFEDYIKNGKKQTGCFWIGDSEVND